MKPGHFSRAGRLFCGAAIASTLWAGACGTRRSESPSHAPRIALPPPAGETGLAAPSGTPAPTAAAAKYEVDLVTRMIDHGMAAVMLADVCLQNAAHDELRGTCEAIMTSQSAGIRSMQAWLQQWYGVVHEPDMTPRMQRQMDGLSALSGEAFERALVEAMVRHQRAAAQEASCVDKVHHRELVGLCRSAATAQASGMAHLQARVCSSPGC